MEVLNNIPEESIDMCVTSPPYYGLRNYGIDNQIGQEETKEKYIKNLITIFEQIKRVLKPQGTFWLNIGDTYCGTCNKGDYFDPKYKYRNGQKISINKKVTGFKPKDLLGIPWSIAFELQKKGWYLRQDIIWYKPNAMPESVKDRCTRSHEYVFLFSKNKKYYFNNELIKVTCTTDLNRKKNRHDVWNINTKPSKYMHGAVFPQELVDICIKAGCPDNGIVIDPFMGSGTSAVSAISQGKHFIGIELNPSYVEIAANRIKKQM